jgi:uncharacterized lipoprotein YddW (UPF0748 family)
MIAQSLFRLAQAICMLALFLPDTQAQTFAPKREFRGAWVATVANIDFPSRTGLDEEKFKAEWTGIARFLSEAGFNAVFAQVRPSGDAFFESRIAPWSKYLSGRQGERPEGQFDPLAFMISTAHQHNLEFHAWLNPYRAAMDTLDAQLASMHPFNRQPEWFMNYGGKRYFNPARPEVRDYITEVVLEILMDYRVDGIHFDDYFYPYPSGAEALPDKGDFAAYGYGFLSIEDWRRHNIDLMIGQVSQMIKRVAPHVKFGVSPFGVWRNISKDPVYGSETRAGINTYDDLYADVRSWLEKGWLDYAAPQLYWNIGFPAADYAVLLKWWQNNSFERHLYIGHAAYKVNNQEAAWKRPDEIPRQIQMNRSAAKVLGSIFYNTNSLQKNAIGFMDSIKSYYASPALLPEMPFLKLPAPETPLAGRPRLKKEKLQLQCKIKNPSSVNSIVLYKFEGRQSGDFNNAVNILGILRLNGRKKINFEDAAIEKGKTYTYAFAATNHAHQESPLGKVRVVEVRNKRIRLLR